MFLFIHSINETQIHLINPVRIIVHPIHCRLVNKATTRKADALVTHLFTLSRNFSCIKAPIPTIRKSGFNSTIWEASLFISASEEKYPFLNPAILNPDIVLEISSQNTPLVLDPRLRYRAFYGFPWGNSTIREQGRSYQNYVWSLAFRILILWQKPVKSHRQKYHRIVQIGICFLKLWGKIRVEKGVNSVFLSNQM